jgi:DNA-directed RNA polymerase subunit L
MRVDDVSNVLFDAYDIRKTLSSHGLCSIKRVHGGTDNEDTLKDLIDNIVSFLEQLEGKINE